MQYMIIEHFRDGAARPVYERFRERGRLAPEGLHYVGSWVTADLAACYQVMECDDRALLDQWMAAWSDLVSFEVIPVIGSADAAAQALASEGMARERPSRGKSALDAVHPVLMARDVTTSLAFYARLGFRTTFQDDPDAPRYAVVRRGPVELHLQWADASQWTHAGDRPAYRFPTPDVDALFHALQWAGVITPDATGNGPYAMPADTPWGTREFHLWDPGRNSLQFYQPLAGLGGV